MPLSLRNLVLDYREDETSLKDKVIRRFSLDSDEMSCFRITRKSLDARKKSSIKYICTVEFCLKDEASFLERFGGDPDVQVVKEAEKRTFPRVGGNRK